MEAARAAVKHSLESTLDEWVEIITRLPDGDRRRELSEKAVRLEEKLLHWEELVP